MAAGVTICVERNCCMSLIDDIKNDVKKAGANKGKIIFFREGQKVRLRFLEDMEDGHKFTFHDSFAKSVNVPCQEIFGKHCKYCEDEELRTRDLYAWSVYDYESKEVKLLLQPVNNCSPIPAIMALYETYGTLTDRDYVFTVTGKQQNKTFSVIPMDKNKFRNEKAKALSESKILSILDKAYPTDDEDDDEEYEVPKKSGKKKPKKADEDEYDEYDDEADDDDEAGTDYSEMSAKELYKLCKERDLECVPKKPAKYYINLLEEDDKAEDDWGDDDDGEDEEW